MLCITILDLCFEINRTLIFVYDFHFRGFLSSWRYKSRIKYRDFSIRIDSRNEHLHVRLRHHNSFCVISREDGNLLSVAIDLLKYFIRVQPTTDGLYQYLRKLGFAPTAKND